MVPGSGIRALIARAGLALLACSALGAIVASSAQAAAPSTPPLAAALTQPVYGQTWAGYDAVAAAPAASGALPHFTKVTGAWTQPAADCPTSGNSQASVWVGLGGVLDTAAVYGPLQVGTDSDCRHGRAQYFAWWEAYPEPLQAIRLKISPQDALTAVVSLDSAGLPVVAISDETTGVGFTKVLRDVHVKALATDSAEWIVEGPARRGITLTDFGSVSFADATATETGPTGVQTGSVDDAAWRYSEPDVLGASVSGAHQSAVENSATPGPLTATGDGFTVNYGTGALSTAQ
ncbi:MAG TPA: G1 family glutamic endopeptidase [Solirubrobacteraceae bacterium]